MDQPNAPPQLDEVREDTGGVTFCRLERKILRLFSGGPKAVSFGIGPFHWRFGQKPPIAGFY
jgi:hypothetical protein